MAIDASRLRIIIETQNVAGAARELQGLGAQVDATGKRAQGAAQSYGTLGKATHQTGQQAGAAGKQVGALGGAFAGTNAKAVAMSAGLFGGAATIGMLGKAAIQTGIQFEDAFAGVEKTVNATDAQLATLEAGIRDMATTMPIAATEIAGLAEAAGALGVRTENILEFSRVTALLGTTTDVTSAQAATSLGQLSNVLNLTAADYERFGSALVELGNNGASTESAILSITERAGAASELIGFATEETLAWGSAVANLGIEADAGGSSLQTFFISTASMVSEMGAELDILAETAGMTGEAFATMFANDSSAALQTFITGLGQLDQAAQLATLSALGFNDVRITRTLLGLASNTDNLTNSLKSAEAGWRENTAMAVEAEKRFETTASEIQILKNQASDMAIGFWEAAESTGAVDLALDSLSSSLSDMGAVAGVVTDVSLAFGNLADTVGDLPDHLPEWFGLDETVQRRWDAAGEALGRYAENAAKAALWGPGVAFVLDAAGGSEGPAQESGIGQDAARQIREQAAALVELRDAQQDAGEGFLAFATDSERAGQVYVDTARLIRDEQQALGNGFQEFSTSAETGFTQSTLSYSRFITAFSGNTETALSSFDALTQSIATGAIDFEQAASLYANIPRDQLVPAVTEAAAELRGKLADATLSEMDARAIEGQVNALKVIFPDLVAEIDGTAEAIRNFGDVQDIFQGVVDVSRDRMSEWESNLSGAESALDILNQQIEDGIPLTKEQEEAYDTLTWATDRYAGGVEDSEQAVVDAEVAKADYIRTLDELNRKLGDNEISQEDYNAAVGDALSKLDPAAGATYDLATAQEEVAGKLDDVIGRLRDLMVELGLIPVEHTISLNLDTSSARIAFDAFMNDVYASNPTAEAGVGFTQRAKGGTIPPGGEFALVGEEGPELMMLPGGAHIYPHDETMRMIRGYATGTDGRPDLSRMEQTALDIIGNLEVVLDPEAVAEAEAELAALWDAKRVAEELGLGDAVIAEINEQIRAKEAELRIIGEAAGTSVGQGITDQIAAELEAADLEAAREALTDSLAGLLSDMDGIISGETGTMLGEKLVEALSLQKIAEQMGDEDLAAHYAEQVAAINEQLEQLGEIMQTPFVEAQIAAAQAAEAIVPITEEAFAGLMDTFAAAPEVVPQFIDDILAGLHDGTFDITQATELLGHGAADALIPGLERIEEQLTVDLVEAILAGNAELEADILEKLALLEQLQGELAETADAADTFRDSATGIFYPSGPANGTVGAGGRSRPGGGGGLPGSSGSSFGGGLTSASNGTSGAGSGGSGGAPATYGYNPDDMTGTGLNPDNPFYEYFIPVPTAMAHYEQTGDAALLAEVLLKAGASGDHGGDINGYMQDLAASNADGSAGIKNGNELIIRVAGAIKQFPELWTSKEFWDGFNLIDHPQIGTFIATLRNMVGAYITGRFYYDEESGLMSPGRDPAGKSLRDRLTNPVYRSVEDAFAGVVSGPPGLGAGPRRTGAGGMTGGFLGSSFRAFADGGIITSPLFGLVGEAGPEMVQPLKQGHPERERLIADIAEAVIRSTDGGHSATFVVDGKVFTETVGKRVMHSVNGRGR